MLKNVIEEFLNMDDAALEKRIKEMKTELLRARFLNASGALDNPKKIPALKKDIARACLILGSRKNDKRK